MTQINDLLRTQLITLLKGFTKDPRCDLHGLKEYLSAYMDDPEVVDIILITTTANWDIIPASKFEDREFVKHAIELNWLTLAYNKNWKDDEEYVRLTTRIHGFMFSNLSPRLYANRDFVLDIVRDSKIKGLLLPRSYQDDEEILLAASQVYLNPSERLRMNSAFMTEMVKKTPFQLKYIKCEIPRDVMCEAFDELNEIHKRGILMYGLDSKCGYTVFELHKLFVAHNGMYLEYVPKKARTHEVIGLAVLQNKEAVKFL